MPLGCLLPLLLLGSVGVTAGPPCGALDYRPVYGPCDAATGRRNATLRRRPGVTCQELAPTKPMLFTTTCECTLDDYVPDLPKCEAPGDTSSSYRPFWREALNACSAGLQLPEVVETVPCPCTELAVTYTDCTADSTRFLVFHYEDGCTPPPRQPAPPPTPVSCSLRCGSGSYLGLDRQRCDPEDLATCPVGCRKCSAGAFSFSGDTYDDLVRWPVGFDTGCTVGYYGFCSNWQLEEGAFWSGDQQKNDNVESWLSTRVLILNPNDAYLQFEYRVESEKTWNTYGWWVGDGLLLYIDGQSVHITNDSFVGGKMYSFQTSPRIPLDAGPSGYVTIKFVYRKDSGATKYGDAAWIRNIRISGTKLFVTTCNLCPVGTFQDDPQANLCDPCPANTFSAAEGSTSCTPCDTDTEWAPAGAAACQQKTTCQADEDFLPMRTCEDDSEVVSYTKVNPHCTIATPLDDERHPSCEPCPAGTLSDGGMVRRCVPCPDGKSAARGATSCESCPAGTYGRKSLRYDTFEGLGQAIRVGFYGELWATSCEGLCASDSSFRGWTLQPLKNGSNLVTVLNSGKWHGSRFLSSLMVNVTLYGTGSVTFQYELASGAPLGNATDVLLVFSRQRPGEPAGEPAGEAAEGLPLPPGGGPRTATFPLSAGQYTLRWDFEASGAASGRVPSCNLWGLLVVGAEEGVVETCDPCPAGHFCPGAAAPPTPCPAGSRSTSGQEKCTACPDGAVALPGTNECMPCGIGSHPAATADFCVPACSIQHTSAAGDWQYELTQLNHSLKAVVPSNCSYGSTDDACSLQYDYHVQLCGGEAQRKILDCPLADGPEAEHAFACQTEPKRSQAWVIGTNRTVSVNTAWEWALEFDGGKFCNSAGRRRRTRVRMVCDSTAALADATLIQLGEEPDCVYNFEFNGLQACPVCTAASVITEEASCINGSRLIRYLPSVPCHAIGFEAVQKACPVCDSITYEVCDANYQGWRRTVYQSNATCWTPGTQDIVEVKLGRCAQVKVDEANRFTIAIALLVGLAGTTTACGAVLGCKHRQLQQAYRTLQARRRGREMMAHTTPFLSSQAGDDIFGDDTEEEAPPAAGAPAREAADDELFPGPPEDEGRRAPLVP